MKFSSRLLLVYVGCFLFAGISHVKAQNHPCQAQCMGLCPILQPVMEPLEDYKGIAYHITQYLPLLQNDPNCSTTSGCQQAVTTLSQTFSSYPLTNYSSAVTVYGGVICGTNFQVMCMNACNS